MEFEFIENEEIVVYGTAQDIANGIFSSKWYTNTKAIRSLMSRKLL